jgi:hypothetical protein
MRIACIALALVVAAPSAAAAFPGLSLSDFKDWAAQKKVLAGMVRVRDELSGQPSFRLLTSDHGIAWRFTAQSDGKQIVREYLAVSAVGKEPGTAPIAHDGAGYGFTFFKALYGSGTASDFKAARLVATVLDRSDNTSSRYYRGALFGYTATRGTLTIATLPVFARDVALAQRCAKAPDSCSE